MTRTIGCDDLRSDTASCVAAALVADGLHARPDGLTSLAVLLGVGGLALGWNGPTRSWA
jgi:hypothetical protein